MFAYIKAKVTFNHYVAVLSAAVAVAAVLAGLANIVGFVVMREVTTDMAGFFLYPTLTVSAVAAVVYLGLEQWS